MSRLVLACLYNVAMRSMKLARSFLKLAVSNLLCWGLQDGTTILLFAVMRFTFCTRSFCVSYSISRRLGMLSFFGFPNCQNPSQA